MEEKINERKMGLDDNREVALGICFGSGIGILVGAVLGNAAFGLSGGGVIGILVGCSVRLYKRIKYKTN